MIGETRIIVAAAPGINHATPIFQEIVDHNSQVVPAFMTEMVVGTAAYRLLPYICTIHSSAVETRRKHHRPLFEL